MFNSFKLRPGDFWRICDRTGRKVPASQTRREWNGLIVDKSVFEPRQPQDFVRGRAERMGVPDPRPRQTDRFVGHLRTTLTAAAEPGDETIYVETTARFEGGDKIEIALDTGEMFPVMVNLVADAYRLDLFRPLPYGAAPGNLVTNVTANSIPDLG
jgi:hypothetical protein